MHIAFTMDDLPTYPHLSLPEGYTLASVATAVIDALDHNAVTGVYAFANSWPLDAEPETAEIFDAWTAAGHHVANHTHSHPLLNDFGHEQFIADIVIGDELMKPWLDRASQKLFRHPLNLWGDTEEKRVAVNAHLFATGTTPADVTSYLFEWEWDRAWRWLIQAGRTAEAEKLKAEFIDFCVAQIAYDQACLKTVFGRDVAGIGLAHYVAFLAEVADPLLARLRKEGIAFVPLEEALGDPAYDRVASLVTPSFHVYQQKLAAAAGQEMPAIVPSHSALMQRVFKLAEPLRPTRRGQLVRNHRGPNP